MKFFKTQKNNRRGILAGFTLVETLVAVAILLVGIAATFSAFHFGLSSTSDTRNRIAAIFLAQEGIEAVKNVKDSNLLAISLGQGGNPNWLKNILTNGNQGNNGPCDNTSCAFDILDDDGNGAFYSCSDADQCNVKLYDQDGDGVGDFFRQGNFSGSPDAGFRREIYVEEVNRDTEAKVRVVITKPNDPDFFFETVTFIYNWF